MDNKQLICLEELNYLDNLWLDPIHKKFDDRQYQTVILNYDLVKPIVDKLLMWFESQTKLKLITYERLLILHRFYQNDYFYKHSDNILIYEKNRAYVVGFHLNNDYLGGEYIIHDNNQIIDNTPGVPYCFDSNKVHEIKPVIDGVRKSALIFINHEDLIKHKLL